MFTDININSVNNKTDHISEKYIFYGKKRLIFSRFKVGFGAGSGSGSGTGFGSHPEH